MRLRALVTMVGVAVGAVVLTSRVHAQESDELDKLLSEPVVTTASKASETGAVAPATSVTLTAEDLRLYGIRSLDEAIDFLSLGMATSNTLRGSEVGARGVLITRDRGSHFLLLINGHQVNEPLFGTAQFDRGTGVPMEMVDHIEVVLGPGSVLYGSNAMFGVINVITKRASDFAGTHAIAETEVGKSVRASVGAGYKLPWFRTPTEITAQVEYYRLTGPTFSFGPQAVGMNIARQENGRFSSDGPPTGVWGGRAGDAMWAEVPAGLLRFVHGDLEIGLHARAFKRSAPFEQRDFGAFTFFDDKKSYELDRQVSLDISYQRALSPIVQLSVRGYGDMYDYQRYSSSSMGVSCLFANVMCRTHLAGMSRWAGSEVQSTFDWLKDSRLVTMLGVDGRLRDISAKSDLQDYRTDAYLASSDGVVAARDAVVGAYVQQIWRPVPWLGLNGGTRLEWDRRFDPVNSPRFAAALQPWHNTTVKAVYSEAFRAPSWGEWAIRSATIIAREELRPERVKAVEGSIEQTVGAHRLVFGVFRSWWRDMIELHRLNEDEILDAVRRGAFSITEKGVIDPTEYRNVSAIDNYGFNGGISGALLRDDRLRYGANVTGASSRRMDEQGRSDPLTVAPSFFGNARVSYALPQPWPTLALAVHWLAKRPADRAFDAGFHPAPFAPQQWELRGTLSGEVPGLAGLAYRLSANWSTASRGPYAVGPHERSTPYPGMFVQNSNYAFELSPIDTFRVGLDLRYDFGR